MNELSNDAKAILEAARHGDDPSPADRERLRGAIIKATALGAAAGVTLSAGTAAGGTAKLTLMKLMMAVVVVGGAATATVVGVRKVRERRVAQVTAPAVADIRIEEAPAVAPVAEAPETLPQEPTRPEPRKLAKHRAPPLRPSDTSADALVAETNDLRDVHDALRDHNPTRALALIDEQNTRYPHGQLEPERSASRIIALCDLKRTAEATTALTRFRRAYPRSPLLERVETACAAR